MTTATFSPEKEVAYADSRVGYHESDNNCQEFSLEQYGVRCPPGGWCMSFASRCAREAGFVFDSTATFGAKGFSYTGAAITWAQRQGLWRDKNYHAKPGDWVIYGAGGGTHVEVVVFDDGEHFITIGGNTGNQVMYMHRDRHNVNCFIALSESTQAVPPLDLTGVKILLDWYAYVQAHPLHKGNKGPRIKTLNDLLLHKGLVARTGAAFGLDTVVGVRHLKLVHDLRDGQGKIDGTIIAGPAAKALLGL